MTTTLPIEPFAAWLLNGERGISSDSIVSHLTGIPGGRGWRTGDDHPHDPFDLRRCELLLRRVPAARHAFPAMATRSPVWAALVTEWDNLVTLLESEAPGVFDGPPQGRAPETYARMRALIDSARNQVQP